MTGGTWSVESLRKAVEMAELATIGVEDVQLRSVALGRVLDRLLTDSQPALLLPVEFRGPQSEKQRSKAPARDGPTAWIASLRNEKFFTQSRTLAEVVEVVRAQGHHVESKNVTDPLEKLVRSKVLRRERKSVAGSTRPVWVYSTY